MLKKEWFEPKAKTCSECPTLEKIKDKHSGSWVSGVKFCPKFGWEITDKVAESQAVCRVSREIKRRKHSDA